MKKIIVLLLTTLIVMSAMCVFASATNQDTYNYTVDGIEYTVEIDDTSITSEKKQVISASLMRMNESEIMPFNIWCTLFGHDYQYTTASVIQHKAGKLNPRCKKETYDVTYCEDCDYTEQTLVNITYINCCPED